jgi:hypothetical protein
LCNFNWWQEGKNGMGCLDNDDFDSFTLWFKSDKGKLKALQELHLCSEDIREIDEICFINALGGHVRKLLCYWMFFSKNSIFVYWLIHSSVNDSSDTSTTWERTYSELNIRFSSDSSTRQPCLFIESIQIPINAETEKSVNALVEKVREAKSIQA